uniref:RNase H type-1 domain-containing protein n=1 Tax=Chromera velia CCMP2878 TaxID=1169474 RepID=A0A0G4HMU7_9ALVE|eukprot:Cvel_29214.t1-p1 / transcript=Cvel_29214.t1 / gene=Cvel_29214 / organism=Chromera_velia_CCMP2878 / gene_product=hypothetical protein / transcript_product=hypothetical protein / location=Cvel_scaffold3957:3910-4286(+) / protein_length=84 / sequence_SO=supercontig / SO=protein_coding / is_pseudo=false
MDSGPLYDQFRSGKAQTDATMQSVLEWCIQEMRVLGADLQWIARSRNVANVMTKCALPGRRVQGFVFAQGGDDWGLGSGIKGAR